MAQAEYQITLPARTETDDDPAIAAVLADVKAQTGRIPNMYARMANVPGLLETYLTGYAALRQHSGFTPGEQQIVFLAISRANGCTYCVSVHSGLADMAKVRTEVTDALRAGEGWLPPLSMVAELDGRIVGHVVCSRARVGDDPALDGGPRVLQPGHADAVVRHQLTGLGVEVEDGRGQRLGLLSLQAPQAGAAEVLYGLGAALGRRGGEDLGLVYLQLALYLVPQHPLALLSLADLYESMKKPALAIKTYERVPLSSPLQRNALIQSALALDTLDRADEVVEPIGAPVAVAQPPPQLTRQPPPPPPAAPGPRAGPRRRLPPGRRPTSPIPARGSPGAWRARHGGRPTTSLRWRTDRRRTGPRPRRTWGRSGGTSGGRAGR